MHWKVFYFIKPVEGQQCIVGRSRDGKKAFIIGTFHTNLNTTFWETNDGYRISCNTNDKWFPVDDMMLYIGDRLANEIKSSLS